MVYLKRIFSYPTIINIILLQIVTFIKVKAIYSILYSYSLNNDFLCLKAYTKLVYPCLV